MENGLLLLDQHFGKVGEEINLYYNLALLPSRKKIEIMLKAVNFAYQQYFS